MIHYDCKYYLSLDVFKGICKLDKNKINADEVSCDKFEKAQKCKFCSNYTATQPNLGRCKNTYDAYPEMNAVTCNEYK
ncbi:MAG: 4-hydroxyphenylacetate decarboxylase small subunit [Bacteroidota bacterium]